jgi:enoyl-CoA hydratase
MNSKVVGRFGCLRVDIRDDVANVTIDKPPANTLDASLYADLSDVLMHLEDAPARVVVFASAHESIFISGRNINEMADYVATESEAGARVDAAQAMFNAVQQFPKPTIGVITGHAMGGGCEFALALDFRIMSRGKCRIGQPEVNLGIIPGGGGTQRLARLVGRAAATELLMLGRRLDADEACAVGLVHRVGDSASDTNEIGAALAAELAAKPPLALVAAKRAIREGLEGSIEAGLAIERQEVVALLLSADFGEGVSAFLEKRTPRFEGR